MKALTIKEPFASLIINGYKKYEFRTWKTNYRGKVLIHAGKSCDKAFLKSFSFLNLDYANGEIIGEVEITDCIYVDKKFKNKLLKEDKSIYENVEIGCYAFCLSNVKKYNERIPCKGKLSFWEFKL